MSYKIEVQNEPIHDSDVPVTDCLTNEGVFIKSIEFNIVFVKITFYCNLCEKEWTKEYLDYASNK